MNAGAASRREAWPPARGGPGCWEIDLANGGCRVFGRTRELHGWHDERPTGWRDLVRMIDPADRRRVLAGFREAIMGRVPVSVEYRTRPERRWILAEGGFRPESGAVFSGTCRDISKWKHREERLVATVRGLGGKVAEGAARVAAAHGELAAREEGIRLALEAAGAGVWDLDFRTGEIEFDAMSRGFLGFEAGRNPGLDELLARIHPDSLQEVVRSLDAIKQPGASDDWCVQFKVVAGDTATRWLLGQGRVHRDSVGKAIRMSGINIDISKRKEAELTQKRWTERLETLVEERSRELRDSTDRFRCLADATYGGVVVIDGGIVADVNPQVAAMFGYEPGEMLGRSGLDFVAPESSGFIAWALSALATDRYEWFGMRKDGSRFPVESRARRISREGRALLVATLSDLTEIRRIEDALIARHNELEQARKLARISEIAAGIVHQICQPLSAIGGNLAALKAWLPDCPVDSCRVAVSVGEAVAHVAEMRGCVQRLRSLSLPLGSSPGAVPGSGTDIHAVPVPPASDAMSR